MKSAEIRSAFLNYFASKDHQIVASSSLVPTNDPTLLFTNAGMVQFKDVFLGAEQRDYRRATSSQRCVRAGGKHNDLENVGYTARHHTFFEMLGNFSFGDYFKREAIRFAWEFLTQELGLAEEKLWITVFHDDHEAEEIWLKEIGVSDKRFSRLGEKDNFWAMGETGPCGPCSEIFYDHGETIAGGPPGSPEEDGDRYIEIWNLVFMQYDRQSDGELVPLPKPSVDTGMGLERISAVLQGVHNNYEIDLFKNLLTAVARHTATEDLSNKSLRVIADHIRSCAFLIADGVIPSNEGRGYVLRRIIRRALRHGHQLGVSEPFFYRLVSALAQEMGEAFPELVDNQAQIERVLLAEEQQFAKTLDQGLKILEHDIQGLEGDVIPGEIVFKLYDTYGFPMDLTADIAREKDLQIDQDGFDTCMLAQQTRARAASQFGADYHSRIKLQLDTEFEGYDHSKSSSEVLALFDGDGNELEHLKPGDRGILVLNKTPFYAESGGQVGDIGVICADQARFVVEDTQKINNSIIHMGVVESGELSLSTPVNAEIDHEKRDATALNHSATHLMHAALRQVLGDHVSQKGSLVNEHYLRFDFSHFEAVSAEQLRAVERLVNEQIRDNTPVRTQVMDLEQAKAKGAMALFGEKYDQQVRVLTMGTNDFSVELCGGTHVRHTGDIGLFKIVSESSVAAGVRRIEAVTGAVALARMQQNESAILQASQLLKVKQDDVVAKLEDILQRNRDLEKQIQGLNSKLASNTGTELADRAKQVAGINVLSCEIEGADAKSLRVTMDQLKNKLDSGIIVIAATKDNKVNLVAGVTQDLTQRFKAGELVNFVAQQVGGKGGGRPDMAQAGGNDPTGLQPALKSVETWVQERA